MKISIRRGASQDAEAISAFVTGISEAFITGEFSAGGRSHFLREHIPPEVRGRLEGDFRFYIAERGAELVGVAAIRSNSHLCYLFVAPAVQRLGLASRLWTRLKDDSSETPTTSP